LSKEINSKFKIKTFDDEVKFINSEIIIENTMDKYRTYLIKFDYETKKILWNKFDGWWRDVSLHVNFKIDTFDLNDNMKFS
jgi:hypothetical protein